MYEVDADTFTQLVIDAVNALPAAYREQLHNVDIQVEEWARLDDYRRTSTPRGSTLLGVYRGIPLTRRGAHYNLAAPDTIVIFSGPLQRLARDAADLEARVGRVVRHEVAHYFGISDERLHELDAY